MHIPLIAGPTSAGGSVLVHVVVAALYFGAGALALGVYPIGDGMAGIWPAAGIAVAAVLIVGPSAALGVFTGDLLVGLHAGLVAPAALALAFGSVGEALLAWLLLKRLNPIDLRLARVHDVARFIVLGAASSAAICVALRVLLLTLIEQDARTSDVTSLFAGLLGHGLGVLVVAPVILTWHVQRSFPRPPAEFLLLMFVAGLLNAGAFAATPVAPGSALLYSVFVVVLWAALRFGPREASSVMSMTGIFATWAAGHASGPFLLANQTEALFSLNLFLLVAATTALFLAAAACEKHLYFRRVAESEHAHRTLIEQMAEGVVMIDPQGRLSYVSDRFCEICGQARERLLGRKLGELAGGADRALIEGSLLEPAGEKDLRAEIVLEPFFGKAIVISVAPRRLTDVHGRPTGTMAIVSDVTERRRAEDLARQHLQQLAHMGRVKSMDEMAIAFAHEIAQPLTAITTYTQTAQRLIRTGQADDPALVEALEGADGEARRAGAIVRRIRGFVQDRPPQPVGIAVDFLIGEILRIAEPEARQHGASLIYDGCGDRCVVRADLIQIQQVLLNLVKNSAEAMAEVHSRVRKITLRSRTIDDGFVEFSVADTGPGIPVAELERVFEPFFTTKADGVGIGLALCRSIIEAHGGRLWADESRDGGAIFMFTLRAHADGL